MRQKLTLTAAPSGQGWREIALRSPTYLPSGDLIKIKVCASAASMMAPEARRESLMPIDTIVVVLMAAAFGIFAATLYWADLRTRGLTR
jgi:hypothetical protein